MPSISITEQLKNALLNYVIEKEKVNYKGGQVFSLDYTKTSKHISDERKHDISVIYNIILDAENGNLANCYWQRKLIEYLTAMFSGITGRSKLRDKLSAILYAAEPQAQLAKYQFEQGNFATRTNFVVKNVEYQQFCVLHTDLATDNANLREQLITSHNELSACRKLCEQQNTKILAQDERLAKLESTVNSIVSGSTASMANIIASAQQEKNQAKTGFKFF